MRLISRMLTQLTNATVVLNNVIQLIYKWLTITWCCEHQPNESYTETHIEMAVVATIICDKWDDTKWKILQEKYSIYIHVSNGCRGVAQPGSLVRAGGDEKEKLDGRRDWETRKGGIERNEYHSIKTVDRIRWMNGQNMISNIFTIFHRLFQWHSHSHFYCYSYNSVLDDSTQLVLMYYSHSMCTTANQHSK